MCLTGEMKCGIKKKKKEGEMRWDRACIFMNVSRDARKLKRAHQTPKMWGKGDFEVVEVR